MSKMKISPTDDCAWLNEDCTLMIDGDTPKEAEIAAGKINNHDRMVEEIAELKDLVTLISLNSSFQTIMPHEADMVDKLLEKLSKDK